MDSICLAVWDPQSQQFEEKRNFHGNSFGACGLDPQQRQSASYLDTQSSGIADNGIFPFLKNFRLFLCDSVTAKKDPFCVIS